MGGTITYHEIFVHIEAGKSRLIDKGVVGLKRTVLFSDIGAYMTEYHDFDSVHATLLQK
jgi:hypothetical protein